jgi:hypothetical protein
MIINKVSKLTIEHLNGVKYLYNEQKQGFIVTIGKCFPDEKYSDIVESIDHGCKIYFDMQ